MYRKHSHDQLVAILTSCEDGWTEANKENERLKAFYKEIASLTSNHSVIDDHACVTADKLGGALEKVDKEWWNSIEKDHNKSMESQDDN